MKVSDILFKAHKYRMEFIKKFGIDPKTILLNPIMEKIIDGYDSTTNRPLKYTSIYGMSIEYDENIKEDGIILR